MPFILPDLPYSPDAFGDLISEETFSFHHGKHHQAYVTKANEMVADDADLQGKSLNELILWAAAKPDKALFNQVGQTWNHSFYWLGLTPQKQEPNAKLAKLINDSFGSLDNLIEALKAEAVGHFASGWALLILQDSKLAVTSLHDADCPVAHQGMVPLFILDVWEHAYYIDYRNARPDYVDAILRNAVNWDFVATNLDWKGVERANQPA